MESDASREEGHKEKRKEEQKKKSSVALLSPGGGGATSGQTHNKTSTLNSGRSYNLDVDIYMRTTNKSDII